jgi:multicomponent Na+:H+ antiporter subunit B
VTAAALMWGVSDLPSFGVADATIHVAGPDYLARSIAETGIPNVVTSTLASYRGYDTLGETTVIFTAGIAVFLLLKRSVGRLADGDKK